MDSINTPSPTQDGGNIKNAISDGAELGVKTGCLLSMLYSLLGFVTILIFLEFWVVPEAVFPEAVLFLVGPALFFYMLILSPVLLLGAITGAILGWLSNKLSGVVSKTKFLQVGILTCVILLMGLHGAFFAFYPLGVQQDSEVTNEANNDYFTKVSVPLTPLQEYLVFMGIPSIMYIVGGGWVSYKLLLKN